MITTRSPFRTLCVRCVLLLTLFLLFPALTSASGIRYIPANKLAKLVGKAHIIDTRSRLEFSMLHIRGAVHIPVGTMMKEDLARVLASDPLQPMIFYCNGYQ